MGLCGRFRARCVQAIDVKHALPVLRAADEAAGAFSGYASIAAPCEAVVQSPSINHKPTHRSCALAWPASRHPEHDCHADCRPGIDIETGCFFDKQLETFGKQLQSCSASSSEGCSAPKIA